MGNYSYLYGDKDVKENDSFGVGGSVYFNPVKTGGHPLGEAAFLEKASNINAHYVQVSDSNVVSVGMEIEYFVDDSPFFMQAGFSNTDGSGGLSGDIRSRSFSIGGFVMENLLIHGALNRQTIGGDSVDTYGPLLKYVGEMGGSAISIEGGVNTIRVNDEDVDEDETGTVTSVDGDFYFTPRFSVGGGIVSSKVEDIKRRTIEFRGRAFFNENLSVEGRVSKIDEDDEDDEDDEEDINMFSITVAYRFDADSASYKPKANRKGAPVGTRSETAACKEEYREVFSLCE